MKTALLLPALLLAFAMSATVAANDSAAPGKPRHAKIDTNGDGVIDRSEAAANPRMAEHFERMDKNKDGRIDASERPQRRVGGADGKGRRGAALAAMDKNGDGRFTRDELAGRERLLQNFAAIDSNRDGALTREEMQAYRQQHGGKRTPQAQP